MRRGTVRISPRQPTNHRLIVRTHFGPSVYGDRIERRCRPLTTARSSMTAELRSPLLRFRRLRGHFPPGHPFVEHDARPPVVHPLEVGNRRPQGISRAVWTFGSRRTVPGRSGSPSIVSLHWQLVVAVEEVVRSPGPAAGTGRGQPQRSVFVQGARLDRPRLEVDESAVRPVHVGAGDDD